MYKGGLFMIYLGFTLFFVGALVGYLGKKIFLMIFKKEPDEIETLKVKGIGLGTLLAGVVIILIYFR